MATQAVRWVPLRWHPGQRNLSQRKNCALSGYSAKLATSRRALGSRGKRLEPPACCHSSCCVSLDRWMFGERRKERRESSDEYSSRLQSRTMSFRHALHRLGRAVVSNMRNSLLLHERLPQGPRLLQFRSLRRTRRCLHSPRLNVAGTLALRRRSLDQGAR